MQARTGYFRFAALIALVILVVAPSADAQDRLYRLPEAARQLFSESEAARVAGHPDQERHLLEQAIEAAGENHLAAYPLYERLRHNLADRGNFMQAIDIAERQLSIVQGPGQEHAILISLVSLHTALHQVKRATAALARLEQVTQRLRGGKLWSQRGLWWQAGMARARAAFHDGAGHLPEAEEAWRACLDSAERHLREHPEFEGKALFVECTRGLLGVLISTGQLAAAESLADPLRLAAGKTQDLRKRPGIDIRVKQTLGRLALEQGRVDEARHIFSEALANLEAGESGDASLRTARLRLQLAMIEMLSGNWEKALDWHRQREAALERAGGERGNTAKVSSEYAYTLLRLGKPGEALAMMERLVAGRRKAYDDQSIVWWETLAFRGIALAANGRRDAALQELRVAIPRLLDMAKAERGSAEAGLWRTTRLNWLLDGYLAVLSEEAGGNGPESAAAMDEAFRMADLARSSTVQRALAASASRARITDPVLAELARKEQDLQREIGALSETTGELLARGQIGSEDKILADLRAELARLRREHAITLAELERRFPDYAALLTPRPIGITALQKLLKPKEAIVSIFAGSDRALIWAIPASGLPRFAIAQLTAGQIDQAVAGLRVALDPAAEAQGRLPAFDVRLAHTLYTQLLAPVEAGWKDASELIVIPHGRLGQLPFGVLLTSPWQAPAAGLPHAEMADAPWLISRVAISQLPAAIALPTLRAPGREQRARHPFIGFGDPVFVTEPSPPAPATRGPQRRGTIRSLGDAEHGGPIDFRRLPPLPETAREIEDIARVLAADRERDVFLQKRASETLAKAAPLQDYRVVMFATHGLMGGEMPGVFQPALALSNPALTGDRDDGLLTLEEILALRLNADWVVLSACNTGAAAAGSRGKNNHAGEAVSGLGRAFFYAGARSLLVTQWAVETESARRLTTEAFRLQASHPAMSRARALQQSSLRLMKESAGKEYSYAHPMFWAPFALVGDGG